MRREQVTLEHTVNALVRDVRRRLHAARHEGRRVAVIQAGELSKYGPHKPSSIKTQLYNDKARTTLEEGLSFKSVRGKEFHFTDDPILGSEWSEKFYTKRLETLGRNTRALIASANGQGPVIQEGYARMALPPVVETIPEVGQAIRDGNVRLAMRLGGIYAATEARQNVLSSGGQNEVLRP